METYPALLNALFGTKIKIVFGYKGGNEVYMAMERGEVQGMGDWSWSNVKTRRPDYLRDGKIRVLMQMSTEKQHDLPDVPLAMDFVKTPEQRELMTLFLAQKSAARPVVAPPGIPADRVKAIRAAFDKMIVDAEFLKDATQAKLDIDPAPAAAIEKVIEIFAKTSEETGAKLRDAIDPKLSK